MTSPIDAPQAFSYGVPIGHEPLNPFVSGIFSTKVAYTQTDKQTHRVTDTLTDNKGRLQLAAREPIKKKLKQPSVPTWSGR